MSSRTGGVLLTGGTGLLAVNWAVTMRFQLPVTLCMHRRGITLAGATSVALDLESIDELTRALDETRPSLVVHAAAMTDVDECETRPDDARHVNVDLATNVARACAATGHALAHISTDHLFGSETVLASESDPVSPINVYGQTKAEAESRVLEADPKALVVRTNFYGWGPTYRRSFSDTIVDSLRAGRAVTLFNDVFYSPILIEPLLQAIHELVAREQHGVFNVAGDDRLSKHEFGMKLARRLDLDAGLITAGSLDDHAGAARRPHEMSLSNQKATRALGRPLGGIDEHLHLLHRQERDGVAAEIAAL